MSDDFSYIDFNKLFETYTGIRFSLKQSDCEIFLPLYKNIRQEPSNDGSNIIFKDEWTSQSFLLNSTDTLEKIDFATIQDLWDYVQGKIKTSTNDVTPGIIWDDFNNILKFADINYEYGVSLEDFVKNLDNFLICTKLNQVGEYWWSAQIKTDTIEDINEDVNYNAVYINNDKIIKYWSPDKYLNDEFKKYILNPSVYSGFLTSTEFSNGGWFSIPEMKVSTKPFEKLKLATILLNLNYIIDPDFYFGHFSTIDTSISVRIKDKTSQDVLDVAHQKSPNNKHKYSDTLLLHWVGLLKDTDEINLIDELGNYIGDPCLSKKNEILGKSETENEKELSHAIHTQITLKPDFDSTKRDFLGTVDAINWSSSENKVNDRNIGILNQSRSFGGASGNIDGGMVTGGIKTDSTGVSVINNSEVWVGNVFKKDLLLELNSPRCFHIQGGNTNASCAIVGGFSQFNFDPEENQYVEFGKSGVLGNMELFIKDDEISNSYFRNVAGFTLNIPRGDGAGYLEVSTENRLDKFEADSRIGSFGLNSNDEQTIAEFVHDKSTTENNYRRYSVSEINGFIFGGNTSGNSYLISQPSNNDIIDTFENIKTRNICVSENIIKDKYLDALGNATTIINNLVSITNENNEREIELSSCGIYRIEYIDGAFKFHDEESPDGLEVISYNFSVDSLNENITEIALPYCGKYSVEYLEGGFVISGNVDENLNQVDFTVDSSISGSLSQSIPNHGMWRVGVIVASTNGGGDIANLGGVWGGKIIVSQSGVDTELFSVIEPSEQDARDVLINYYSDICFKKGSVSVRFVDEYNGSYIDNTGSYELVFEYLGPVPGCVSNAKTEMQLFINGNYKRNIFETVSSSGGSDNIETLCITNPGTKLGLRVQDVRKFQDNTGTISVKITYLGLVTGGESILSASNCECGYQESVIGEGNQYYGSTLIAEVNGNVVQSETQPYVFFSDFYVSENELYRYLKAKPEKQYFDFCAIENNSTLKVKTLKNRLYKGSVNFRVRYLGKIDSCDCTKEDVTQISESLNISNTEVTITYTDVDPSKVYPVKAHGMKYVGNTTNGISTGGRCEYNDIDDITCILLNKYKLSSSTCSEYDPDFDPEYDSLSDIQKDGKAYTYSHRILDLVYKYDVNNTWIRKDNMMESVYYHTGVGDSNYALFFGGIHETLSNYEYSVVGNNSPTINPDDLECDNEILLSEESNKYGFIYKKIFNETNNTCYVKSAWENAGTSYDDYINDPRYNNMNTVNFGHAKDFTNFPNIVAIEPYPANSISVSSYVISPSADVDAEIFTTNISAGNVSLGFGTQMSGVSISDDSIVFLAEGKLESGNSFVGPWFIDAFEITIENLISNVYPLISGGYKHKPVYEITSFMVENDTTSKLFFVYSDSVSKEYIINGSEDFYFGGYGYIQLPPMMTIWEMIKTSGFANMVPVKFFVDNIDDPVVKSLELNGTAKVIFGVTTTSDIMVGVENKTQHWSVPISYCNDFISNIVTVNFEYSPQYNSRWGQPLWTKSMLDVNESQFNIDIKYYIDKADQYPTQTVSNKVGQYIVQQNVVSFSTNSLYSILNNNAVISGERNIQIHDFAALNSSTIDITSYTCENIEEDSNNVINISTVSGSGENTYCEYVSSFIQEYRNDERFNGIDEWIPSNSYGIKGNNKVVYSKQSQWKRFMDGVGLGGDAIDYDKLLLNTTLYQEIGKWYVGQMAFGTTNQTIIVGGHEIDRNIAQTGRNSGLHSNNTSSRTFLWNLTNIPEEDTYCVNYVGRRLWDFYKEETEVIDNKSTFSIKIDNLDSDILSERQGTITFDGRSSSVNVVFDKPLPDGITTDYVIIMTPNDNVKVWWTDKTNSGFTVECEIKNWRGIVDYTVVAKVKLEKDDIMNKSIIDGYEFDK